MKVAFFSHIPLCLGYGGLEIQMERTAQALQSIGVEVQFLDYWQRSFSADILHIFGSEYQMAEAVFRARALHIPTVVSAVFVPVVPPALYACTMPVLRRLPIHTSLSLRSALLGAATKVVAQTPQEKKLLHYFGVNNEQCAIIPNGVEQRFFSASPELFTKEFGISDYILCVASVEPRKNQLRLLQAVKDIDTPLVLIGKPDARFPEYIRSVENIMQQRKNSIWLHTIPNESPLLASAFAGARVHILPSLSESHGLVSSEALAAGANIIVADQPHLREIFGAAAYYCQPTNISSIAKNIQHALSANRGEKALLAPPHALCDWKHVAELLRAEYVSIVRNV